MTKTEVIAIAQRAGYPHVGLNWNDQEQAFLMRFAALVAAAEREACAQVAMEFRRGAGDPVCGEVATAIRERNSHVA